MNKTLTMLVCIMVAGVVVGASLPIFDSMTSSSETVYNDGAGWVRFALDRNAGTEYTVTISEDENGVYVTNGSDVQTYDDSSTADFETILYADSNLSVWCDSAACHVMGIKDGNTLYHEGTDSVTIVRDANGVTVTPGSDEPLQFDVPTWAYIPVSNGNYGFFAYDEERGVKNYPNDMPLAVVGGGFAGVYAYNNIFRYNGLGLGMDTIYDDDGLFYGASWSKTAAAEEESDNITLDPIVFDPSIIDIDDPFNPEPDASIMAVPTPTYTEGDWGYDLTTVDGVTKAVIVSYSGSGGDIVVPATIGGYDVYQFGKGLSSSSVVFDNSTLSANSTITFSSGIEVIGQGACYSITKLVGDLVIPDTVKRIENYAFDYCRGLDGNFILPSSVTYIGSNAFDTCDKLQCDGLDLSNLTSMNTYATFQNCYLFTGELKLPTAPTITQLGNNTFNACKFTGVLDIPEQIVSLGKYCFGNNRFSEIRLHEGLTTIGNDCFSSYTTVNMPILIPSTITSIGASAFGGTGATDLIINSDFTPSATSLKITTLREVLDLSSYDYVAGSDGIPATAVISDSIGDSFGFISVVEYTTGGGATPTQTLIAMLPLVMVLGLVLMAVGIFIWNRM